MKQKTFNLKGFPVMVTMDKKTYKEFKNAFKKSHGRVQVGFNDKKKSIIFNVVDFKMDEQEQAEKAQVEKINTFLIR